MSARTDKSTAKDFSAEEILDLLRRMYEIRFFEDECARMYPKGLIHGSMHLGQGQEAVSVGACSAVQSTDTAVGSYRGHALALAKGAPLNRSFGEILGKEQGLCRGKGGSMHFTDVSVGAMGCLAIVGAQLPLGLGMAFAAQYTESDAINLAFFGDGCTNTGAFHEALNLAAVWRAPVLFICENNLYGEYTPQAVTTPISDLSARAASYGMAADRVDGNDVLKVQSRVAAAAIRARAGEGPTLIECLTYRQKGHSRSDAATYRPPGELEEWLERDPLDIAIRHALTAGASEEEVSGVRETAERVVARAAEEARSWNPPPIDQRLEDLFA